MRIQGRTAIVTGAASGLGRATAEFLLRSGARVAFVDRDERLEREVGGRGDEVLAIRADVSEPEDVRRVVTEVASKFGGVHILVNAAGIAPARRILERGRPSDLDEFRHVIDINLIATFDMMRWCAAEMARNEPIDGERGVIVNVSSGAAWQGQRGQAAYAASKAGVIGLTLPVARDLARDLIRVVAIAPGLFDTAMSRGLPAQVQESLERMILHPARLGDPNEFAMLVGHIVTNPYINATTVSIDAGVRMT